MSERSEVESDRNVAGFAIGKKPLGVLGSWNPRGRGKGHRVYSRSSRQTSTRILHKITILVAGFRASVTASAGRLVEAQVPNHQHGGEVHQAADRLIANETGK